MDRIWRNCDASLYVVVKKEFSYGWWYLVLNGHFGCLSLVGLVVTVWGLEGFGFGRI